MRRADLEKVENDVRNHDDSNEDDHETDDDVNDDTDISGLWWLWS